MADNTQLLNMEDIKTKIQESGAFFKEMFSNLFSKCESEITNNLVTQLSNITPKY